MTKYEITKFTARNIANLDDVTFETNGDVLITGKNGVGKSSIKKALMWVLNGATADGEKLINPNASGLPFAEVTLSDGTTSIKFGKEITQKIDPKSGKISRSTEHYGLPKQKDFQAHFESITPIFEIMVDLFGFSKLRADVQRAVLLNHFSTVTDADVVAGCTDLAELNFGSMEPEIYKKSNKAWAVKLGKELESIPRQIAALKNQLVDETPINAQRTTLQKTLSGFQAKFEELEQQLLSRNEQADILRKLENKRVNFATSLKNAQSDKKHCERKIAELNRRLDDLREDWRRAENFCPTCGQPINADKTAQIRSAICRKADDVQAETAKYQDELNGINTAIERLQNELEKFSDGDDVKQKDELNAIIAAQREISGKISSCQRELSEIETTLKFNEKTRKAIDELKVKHKQLADDMAGHERLADLTDKFILRKSNMVTEEINSHFKHVAFKMFETTKGGEIKSVCDVTLNGVAEDNLSKGEKLLAALDILQAFQKEYGVMLPLIIDDAESYTTNTLGDVPNQKILFKVVEDQELKVNDNA